MTKVVVVGNGMVGSGSSRTSFARTAPAGTG